MSLFRNISHFLKSSFASYFCYDTQFLIHLQFNTWRYEWHLLLDEVLDVSRIYGGETPILLQVRVIIQKLNCFMFILLGCISLSRPPTRHSIPLSSIMGLDVFNVLSYDIGIALDMHRISFPYDLWCIVLIINFSASSNIFKLFQILQ